MTDNDLYRVIALDYIHQIQQFSSRAAASLETLRISYGDRAAYLAAFAFMCLKLRRIPCKASLINEEIRQFTFYDEMKDEPEAIRLYEEAAAHLFNGDDKQDSSDENIPEK